MRALDDLMHQSYMALVDQLSSIPMPVQPRPRLLERIYHQQHDSAPTFVPHYDRMSGDLVGWRW